MSTENASEPVRIIDENFPPIKDRCVTLIRVAKDGARFATTVAGKRQLLAQAQHNTTYLAVWTGQYKSDVFDVTPDVRQRWVKDIG